VDFTTVVGLEVHVQLRTETKLFCRCRTVFGAPPNTLTCPTCLGLPGALPVINQRAIELGMRAGLALNCVIPPLTKWDRKQYFYPDLPKGYQISQFDQPLAADGWLEFTDPSGEGGSLRIGIVRAHLEEDAGKSMHDERSGQADTRIDLNRAGTPLLEIVTRPDLRSPAAAKAFLTELKLLLQYLDVSDCNMQEGSLRVDANVNLHVSAGDRLIETPIVEIKNMNSFRAVERALEYEVGRQYEHWRQFGGTRQDTAKQTRGWDDQAERTYPQREKEESSDYRYFPDPDLPAVRIEEAAIEAARSALGELPAAVRRRLETQYGLKPYDADVLVNQGPAAIGYLESVIELSGDPRRASAWLQQDVARAIREHQRSWQDPPLSSQTLGELLRRVSDGALDNNRARDVYQFLIEQGGGIAHAISSLGITTVDENAVEQLCHQVLAQNPQVIEDVRGGNQKAISALVGQAKRLNPNVNPGRFRQLCLDLIAAGWQPD